MIEDTIIKLESVSTVYEGERRPAIRSINLNIKRNELVYVVGPNASGKTTLLETINGLLPPFKGKVTVFGLDLKSNGRKIRCQIGYVPQDGALFSHLNVMKNIGFSLKVRGIPSDERETEINI